MLLRSAQLFLLVPLLAALPRILHAQGSIVPTTAPNVPIMKTLGQIEPRTDLKALYDQNHDGISDNANYEIVISASGSYYLSSNMGPNSPMPVTLANAIHVTAAGVTIDLNGFNISRTSGTGGDGISVDPSAHSCAIKNGLIKGFASGVRCSYNGTNYARSGSLLQVTFTQCTNWGVQAGEGWEIAGCKVNDNPGSGIFAGGGATLSNCTVTNNQGGWAIDAGNGAVLNNCTAYKNQTNTTISAGSGSTLSNCTAYNNQTASPIFAEAGSTLTNCSAQGNSSSNILSAIAAGQGSTLTSCTANNNINTNPTSVTYGVGISAGDGSTINNCTVQGNTGDGIHVTNNCVITNSNCDGNGAGAGIGAGIGAVGNDNRIQHNSATHNEKGIRVNGSGNLVDGNQVRDNSGFGIEVPTANGKNVIIRNEAGNNNTSYGGVNTTGNQMAPTGDPSTSTNPFLNILN